MTREQREARWRQVCDAVLASPDALAFVAEFVAMAGVLSTPYAADDRTTAFNCGRQLLGLQMLAALKAIQPTALERLNAAMLPLIKEAPRD